jgi:hypothetical protein
MTNRLADARTALYGALAPILPGRVSATPPAGTAYVAPYIWLDQPDLAVGFVGSNTRLTVATFPVWIAYDGAVRSQVAGLDDVLSKVWDACLSCPAAMPQSTSTQALDVGGATLRGVVVAVDVTLGAVTLCLPDPVTVSPIPPEPALT